MEKKWRDGGGPVCSDEEERKAMVDHREKWRYGGGLVKKKGRGG